jgi:precorrin isomerase
MDPFLKMDVFFAVTTLAVVIVSALACLALLRLLSILKKVDELSSRAQEEGERILADIGEVRAGVRREALKAGQVLGLLGGLLAPGKRKKAKKGGGSDAT